MNLVTCCQRENILSHDTFLRTSESHESYEVVRENDN